MGKIGTVERLKRELLAEISPHTEAIGGILQYGTLTLVFQAGKMAHGDLQIKFKPVPDPTSGGAK